MAAAAAGPRGERVEPLPVRVAPKQRQHRGGRTATGRGRWQLPARGVARPGWGRGRGRGRVRWCHGAGTARCWHSEVEGGKRCSNRGTPRLSPVGVISFPCSACGPWHRPCGHLDPAAGAAFAPLPRTAPSGRRLPPVTGSAGAEAGARTRTVPVRALGWRQQPWGGSPAAAGQLFPRKGQP